MLKSLVTLIKILFSCLIAALVIYFGIRAYTKLGTNPNKVSLLGSSDYTVGSFLNNLSNSNTSKYQEHQRLYRLLSSFNKEPLHEAGLPGNIPYDYQFFFQNVIPSFL